MIDRVTGQPIVGANVAIRRSEWMKDDSLRPIEVSRHTTDAEGRFSVTIPPEQVAVAGLYLQLDVEHPDYAGTKGGGYSLAMIRKNETLVRGPSSSGLNFGRPRWSRERSSRPRGSRWRE